MDFVWNARKAALNLAKHEVLFEEACTALRDKLSITDGDTIRIISARPATKAERRLYEEG